MSAKVYTLPVEDRHGRAWLERHRDTCTGVAALPVYGRDAADRDSAAMDVFAREIEVPFFVDWLTLDQQFDFEVPEFSGGMVQGTDVHGEVQWRIVKASQVEGSFDTSVQIRSHANRVTFSGNVSRFGRPDNVFGYDLGECLQRVNVIMGRLGLPAFTMGQRFYDAKLRPRWTGCRVKRIDLTANYETGSESNLRDYLEWLATMQGSARVKVGTHGDGETVDWGRGSRRVYAKAYGKPHELERHGCASPQLVHWAKEVGLLRFEVTVKQMQLATMGCDYLGGVDMGQLVELFRDRAAVLMPAQHTVDDLDQLPRHFRGTARDYLAGDDVRATMSLATFKRHRAALIPFGIDIAVKRKVIDFKPRVRVIGLSPARVPVFYEFDGRKAA
jgi:hypothetical protein